MSDSASVIDSRAEDGQASAGGGSGADEAKGTNGGGGSTLRTFSEQAVSLAANSDLQINHIAGINSRPAPQTLRQVEHILMTDNHAEN